MSRSRPSKKWPRKVTFGRESVTIYKRITPAGNPSFMVANYAGGKRRFESYSDEDAAVEAAQALARKLSSREVLAASMTNEQASQYATAVQILEPFDIDLPATASTVAECLKMCGGLPQLLEAARFYQQRHKRVERKRVREVTEELLKIKKARGASDRYLQDLRSRLGRFSAAFECDTCAIQTSQIQAWLDGLETSPQSYQNYRRVLNLLFGFSVARNYASENPVTGVEQVKVRAGEIAIYTPAEIARLLRAAPSDFLPALAIGAFAGLRSAELVRLEWGDVDLVRRHIVVGVSRSKTASRRIVPIADNLAAWLQPYANLQGRVWPRDHDRFYKLQAETAAATKEIENAKAGTAVAWKANGLRHSYASYRFALLGDAGRVAGELGNSAVIVHRHYRELVTAADAKNWFGIKPEVPQNILIANPAAAA